MTRTNRSKNNIQVFEESLRRAKKHIERLDKDKCFVTGDDGFIYFDPPCNQGYFSEWNLRYIADELERRNAKWKETIENDDTIA